MTFPSLTSFCHFFGVEVEGIYHKQKGFVREREHALWCQTLSTPPSHGPPPSRLCNKNSLISFVKQQPPTTWGLPQQLEPPTFGHFLLTRLMMMMMMSTVGRLPSPLCMYDLCRCGNFATTKSSGWDLRLETRSYHQVETWETWSLARHGPCLLMRVAAKHDCKKRLVSHTFSVRARGGRGHLSWKSLANKKDQEKIKNTFSIVKHTLYIPFLLVKCWVELSWVEGKIPTQGNFCNWYFFLSAPTTHWYHHLLELRPLRS